MIKKIIKIIGLSLFLFLPQLSQAQLVFRTDMEVLNIDCSSSIRVCLDGSYSIKKPLFQVLLAYCFSENNGRCTQVKWKLGYTHDRNRGIQAYVANDIAFSQQYNNGTITVGYQECGTPTSETSSIMCYLTVVKNNQPAEKGNNFWVTLSSAPRNCGSPTYNPIDRLYVPGQGCLVESSTTNPNNPTATRRSTPTAPSYCKQCPTGDAALAENNTNLWIDNSVQVATGAKIDNEADISYPIPFSRNYSSQRLDEGTLGFNWRHNYERNLSIYYSDISLSTALTLTFTAPNNEQLIFIRNSAEDTFTPFFKDHIGYTVSVSGTQYILNAPNGSKEYYQANMVNGKADLIKTETASGYAYTYTYNALSQLISITDSYGRFLNFIYNDYANVLTQINASNGDSVSYNYLNGYLVEAKFNNVEVKNYSYSYGNLIGKTSPNGVTNELYTYDNQHRVIESKHQSSPNTYNSIYQFSYSDTTTTVTLPDGATATYTLTSNVSQPKINASNLAASKNTNSLYYDVNGNVSSYNDGINGATLIYDLTTNLLNTSNYRGIARTYNWDTVKRVVNSYTETTSAFSKTYSFLYDANNNITQKQITTGGQSRTWNYTYSSFGKMTSMIEPTGATTTITYYSDADANINVRGMPYTITNPMGHVTTFNSYNAQGKPTSITYPNSITKTMTYDLRGRVLIETQLGATHTYTYDAAGLMTQASLSNGYTLNMTYDLDQRLTGMSDNRGNSLVYTLDTNGNITNESEYRNSVLVSVKNKVFDSLSRMTQVSRAANSFPYNYSYDKLDRPTTIQDPNSNNQTITYDNKGKILTTTGLDRNQTATRNTSGNMTQLNQAGNITTFTYNGFGEVLSMTNYDQGTQTYSNNVSGKTFTHTDNANVIHTTMYDNLGRPTSIAHNNQYETYSWDSTKLGKLSSISDNSGSTTYNYDTNSRLFSKTQIVGSSSKQLGYTYDNSGQVIKITYPSGMEVNYQYNNGEISGVQVGGTVLLNQVSYKGFDSLPVSWTWGNSTTRNFSIDPSDRFTSLVDNSALSQTFSQDNVGNITGITDIISTNNTFSATYSFSSQLTSFNHVLGNKTLTQDTRFNLKTVTPFDGGTSFLTFNVSSSSSGGNKINNLSYAGVLKYPTHDVKGNMITDGKGATFGYDLVNNMTSYSKTLNATYTYNALHQRVSKTVVDNGVSTTTYYLYNESGLLVGEYDSSGNAIMEHIYLGNIPVGVTQGSNIYYVHTDHLGTPRAVSNNSGTIVWKWENTNPYGYNLANETVSGTPFKYNMRFPGQYYDAESGLHYNYHRMYSPELGRYLQPDPMAYLGGMNSYAYVENNPLGASDPYGLWSTEVHNKIIRKFFKTSEGLNNFNPALLERVKQGSAYADSADFQFGPYGYMHAMRDPVNWTYHDAQTKMCGYIKEKMALYRQYSQEGRIHQAFFELGMALHPVMDSTSPAHQGLQYWDFSLSDASTWRVPFRHGDLRHSIEKKINNQQLAETVNKMNDVFNGDYKSCGCQ